MRNFSDREPSIAIPIIFTVLFIGFIVYRIIADVQFDQNCEGYMKRAADANTVEIATKEMERVVNYLEEHHLDDGYTSIVYKTPDEDIKFWHDNMVTSLKELRSISPKAGQLEKSNILMKLRETLIDEGGKNSSVTVPAGISVYPHNGLSAICGILFFTLTAGFWVRFITKADLW